MLDLIQALLENRVYFYRVVYIAIMVWAIWKGAGPERMIASCFIGMFFANRLYRGLLDQPYLLIGVDPWSLFIDTAMCIGLITIALHANRTYPLWIAGLQIIALQAHLARAIAPDIAPLVYFIMVVAPSYGQLLAFALGIRAHQKRYKIHGNYRSWRSSSFLSRMSGRRS